MELTHTDGGNETGYNTSSSRTNAFPRRHRGQRVVNPHRDVLVAETGEGRSFEIMVASDVKGREAAPSSAPAETLREGVQKRDTVKVGYVLTEKKCKSLFSSDLVQRARYAA